VVTIYAVEVNLPPPSFTKECDRTTHEAGRMVGRWARVVQIAVTREQSIAVLIGLQRYLSVVAMLNVQEKKRKITEEKEERSNGKNIMARRRITLNGKYLRP
jgi:hypothetical protein